MDDPVQWKLKRRKGNQRAKNSGWSDRCFCSTKAALLRCIREYSGDVSADALLRLLSLSALHPDRDRRNQLSNLDVFGTSRAPTNEQSEPFASQTLKACEE